MRVSFTVEVQPIILKVIEAIIKYTRDLLINPPTNI
jgi:hypothetical protein